MKVEALVSGIDSTRECCDIAVDPGAVDPFLWRVANVQSVLNEALGWLGRRRWLDAGKWIQLQLGGTPGLPAMALISAHVSAFALHFSLLVCALDVLQRAVAVSCLNTN
jgi:hypothetical protein